MAIEDTNRRYKATLHELARNLREASKGPDNFSVHKWRQAVREYLKYREEYHVWASDKSAYSQYTTPASIKKILGEK